MSDFDNGGDQPLAMASAKGTVKWFNSTKGYGFITLENGSDAFCHASALANLPAPNLPQGATVVCDLQDSPRGLQVVTVHEVDTSTADPMPQRRPRPGGGRFGGGGYGEDRFGGGDRFGGHDSGPSGPMADGTVKFFNEQKGFGFVVPDGGGSDIYLHASALRRSGIMALSPEQRIRYSTRQGMKGVEVDRIEVV